MRMSTEGRANLHQREKQVMRFYDDGDRKEAWQENTRSDAWSGRPAQPGMCAIPGMRRERNEKACEMKAFYAYLCLAVLFAISSSAHAKDPLADLYGTWKIQAIIGGGAVSSISDREARQLIGKTFQVKAKRFIFNGQACTETSYEETIEETVGHFERQWNTEVKGLPLPDPVTVIDTGCNTLYPLMNGKLMVAQKGVFFEAARMKPSRSH